VVEIALPAASRSRGPIRPVVSSILSRITCVVEEERRGRARPSGEGGGILTIEEGRGYKAGLRTLLSSVDSVNNARTAAFRAPPLPHPPLQPPVTWIRHLKQPESTRRVEHLPRAPCRESVVKRPKTLGRDFPREEFRKARFNVAGLG